MSTTTSTRTPRRDPLVVAPRFNGPITSGNGGYSCGLFAQLLDGPAEVALRSPVPLDTELTVEADGENLRISDGDAVVATVEPADALVLEVPQPPTLDQARAASARYRAPSGEIFSCCFVCGPDRDDAMGVYGGSVEGRSMVASPWTPSPDGGEVPVEILWAVLDCPTYFALYPHESDGMPMAFLARMQAEIAGAPVPGGQHVVVAWPIERNGRKLTAGSAVYSPDGSVLAAARVLLIEAKAESGDER
ncbi:MAG: hypothetical protein ACR2NA_05785 [Solirubrobacterales bacterium]